MKKDRPIEAGVVVRSKAGRDEGRHFIVLSVESEEFVKVADSDLRKVEKQKLKRVKHLYVTEELESSLQKKLLAGERVENHELRACLARFKPKEG